MSSVEDIDKELKLRVQRRQGHTREISRLSSLVITETREIDRLLAERSEVTALSPLPATTPVRS